MDPKNLATSFNRSGTQCQELYRTFLIEHLGASQVYRNRQEHHIIADLGMMAEEPIILDLKTVSSVEYHAQCLYSSLARIPDALFDGDLKRIAEFFVIPEFLNRELVRYVDLTTAPAVGRPDLLFTPEGFQFIEQNLFCAVGSYQRVDAAASYFDAHPVTQSVRKHHALKRLSFFDSFAAEFRVSALTGACYIIDVAGESGERIDTCGVALATALRRKEIPVEWKILKDADRAISFGKGGSLITLYSPKILARRIDFFGPLFELARQCDIEVLGDLSDLFYWDKQLLAVLSDPILGDFVTIEERKSLDMTLPWTRLLRPHRTKFRGDDISVLDFTLANKDMFVVKKGASTGGEATHLGIYYSQKSWEEIVGRAVKEGAWIVQERVNSLQRVTCTLSASGIEYFYSTPICSPYMIKGRLVDFLVLHYNEDDHSRDTVYSELDRKDHSTSTPGVSAVFVAE